MIMAQVLKEQNCGNDARDGNGKRQNIRELIEAEEEDGAASGSECGKFGDLFKPHDKESGDKACHAEEKDPKVAFEEEFPNDRHGGL